MRKLLSIGCLLALAALGAALTLTCIRPPDGHYDFNLRMNELVCVRQGVNPYAVWHGDVELKPFYANTHKGPIPEDCTKQVNAYAPWAYVYMLPISLLPEGARHGEAAAWPSFRNPASVARTVRRMRCRGWGLYRGDRCDVLDEIQKVRGWSDIVKRLWDEDTFNHVPLKVVLLGSSRLLLQKGLDESLEGRFELLHADHWSYLEMRDAFGFSIEDYILYGGYPGAAALKGDETRFRA